jgi:hypothetical protein
MQRKESRRMSDLAKRLREIGLELAQLVNNRPKVRRARVADAEGSDEWALQFIILTATSHLDAAALRLEERHLDASGESSLGIRGVDNFLPDGNDDPPGWLFVSRDDEEDVADEIHDDLVAALLVSPYARWALPTEDGRPHSFYEPDDPDPWEVWPRAACVPTKERSK